MTRETTDKDRAAIDTPRIKAQVEVERAKAKDGRLTLAPGTHFIESGSIFLAPGQTLIACQPEGICSIVVTNSAGATWDVAPQKAWDDAEAERT